MTEPSDRERPSLLAEMKRRHVYRIGAMYAAVSFVLWQAADIAVPALGLPDAVMRVIVIAAIVGFPIALALAWVYELTPEGIRTTDALDAAHGDARVRPPVARRGGARRRLALASLVVLTVLTGAFWVAGDRLMPRSADPDEFALAVFPFAVRGGDGLSYLREGMVDLLSRNLAGAAELQPLDASLILRVSGGAAPSDQIEARALAARAGAAHFVLGTVTQAGGTIRIDAGLFALRNGEPAAPMRTVQGDTTQLFDLIDRLTAELLAGHSAGAASDRMVRTAAGTTSSLDALKAYLDGERFFRLGEHDDGITAFRRALDHDSTFALARYRLALSYHMRGAHGVAYRESMHALRDADRLNSHERRVIESFHAYHEGRITDAERQLRTILRDYPRDLEARLILAQLLVQYAPLRGEPMTEARQLLEAVIEADPRFACIYCQLSAVSLAEGDLDAAERWTRLAGGAVTGDTTRVRVPYERFYFAAGRGDTTAMRAAYAALDTVPRDAWGARVLTPLANHAMLTGHFPFVDALLRDADSVGVEAATRAIVTLQLAIARGEWRAADARVLDHARASGTNAGAARTGVLVSLLAAPLELRLPAHDSIAAALRAWTPAHAFGAAPADAGAWLRAEPAVRHYLLGLSAARIGATATARAHADTLGLFARSAAASDTPYLAGMARVIRADLALRAGNAAIALRELDGIGIDVSPELAHPLGSAPGYAARLRAAAYAATGQYERAHRWLRHGVAFYGSPLPAEYATWHRDMAAALEALGRHEEASVHRARFVAAWAGADAALLPQVDAARVRLGERR